jgi:UDP-N-acetylglucosamine diphosphorylase/glucosamine-1-phosphate N-acetyltransferase
VSSLHIFDDDLGQFGPMTDLRASFEVRSGMLTNAGRIELAFRDPLAGYHVPQRLAELVRHRATVPVNKLAGDEPFLLINGRWGQPDSELELGTGQALIEAGTGELVAARLSRSDAEATLAHNVLPDTVRAAETEGPVLSRYPWDVLGVLREVITGDILAVRLLDAKVPDASAAIVGSHAVEIHETATVHPNVVLDAQLGPIAVLDKAVIRPGAVICGPCSIGSGTVIVDHALIKPGTAIGPYCKVGGEVGATVFQGYANKTHDGHLGDSWVGKWANFGAGTTNSNLLNTYDQVAMRVEPDGPRRRTGMTFLGAIVGDHVKLAINTRLMTGTVLGTGAMIATTPPSPTTVRRFAWLTDDGERVYRWDRFLQTARKVMARRDKTPDGPYEQAMHALHESSTG